MLPVNSLTPPTPAPEILIQWVIQGEYIQTHSQALRAVLGICQIDSKVPGNLSELLKLFPTPEYWQQNIKAAQGFIKRKQNMGLPW